MVSKEVCRIIELDAIEINQNFSAAFKNWVSHPLYVFSPRLVNPLLRIGKLLELQLQLHNENGIDDLNLGLEIAEVEEMLLRLGKPILISLRQCLKQRILKKCSR